MSAAGGKIMCAKRSSHRSRLVTEGRGHLIASHTYDSHNRSLTSQRAYGPERLSLTIWGAGSPNAAFRIQHS